MEIEFFKMHGLGNSFVVVFDWSESLEKLAKEKGWNDLAQLSIKICDKNVGIGADGLVLLQPPRDDSCDCTVLHYNSDGSLAEICGNALRCCHFIVMQNAPKNIFPKKNDFLRFLTGAGIKNTSTVLSNETKNTKDEHLKNTITVRATMGEMPEKCELISIENRNYYSISMGNPHAVCFVEDFDFDYQKAAEKLQQNKTIFPQGVNVEYAQIINDHEINIKVIERGVGETLCCGSGACAVASVAIIQKKINAKTKINMHLLGGTLCISVQNKELIMQGAAHLVAKGRYLL